MRHIEKACEFILPSSQLPFILEFGVFQGYTISLIKEKVQGLGYEIYGFDSFHGLPNDWKNNETDFVYIPKGGFNLNGQAPEIQGVNLIKGLFEDTIFPFLEKAQDIALLHIDCDLYDSTKTVLYNLNDYIKPGTIIVFDEWIYAEREDFNDHEQKCFHEWARDFNRKYELINHNCSTIEQQIVKILE